MTRFWTLFVAMILPFGGTQAQSVDDISCGQFAEYVMDLAYDQGAPATLAPTGTIKAEGHTCILTDLVIEPAGVVSIKIAKVTWFGRGLTGWMQGVGWPKDIYVEFAGARSVYATGTYPLIDWINEVKGQRTAVKGIFRLQWNPRTGVLNLKTGFLRSRYNIAIFSGTVSGLVEGPIANSYATMRVQDFKAEIQMDGVFENLLSPLLTLMPEGQTAPQAAFERFQDLMRSHIAVLPAPQINPKSKAAMQSMLATLPAPTGTMSFEIMAPDGLQLAAVVSRVLGADVTTPQAVGALIGTIMGEARLTFGWRPGIRIR